MWQIFIYGAEDQTQCFMHVNTCCIILKHCTIWHMGPFFILPTENIAKIGIKNYL